jgi:hypothetical protein
MIVGVPALISFLLPMRAYLFLHVYLSTKTENGGKSGQNG